MQCAYVSAFWLVLVLLEITPPPHEKNQPSNFVNKQIYRALISFCVSRRQPLNQMCAIFSRNVHDTFIVHPWFTRISLVSWLAWRHVWHGFHTKCRYEQLIHPIIEEIHNNIHHTVWVTVRLRAAAEKLYGICLHHYQEPPTFVSGV